MEKHDLFPFSFEDWNDPGTFERMMFERVTFLEDFGVFKCGEHVETLTVCYDLAALQVHDFKGDVVKSQSIRAVPMELEQGAHYQNVELGGSD